MAKKRVYFGSTGPFIYDNTNTFRDGTTHRGIDADEGRIGGLLIDLISAVFSGIDIQLEDNDCLVFGTGSDFCLVSDGVDFRLKSGATTHFVVNTSGDLAVTGDVTGANLNISNWDAAYTHISSTGADHTYIDQAVTIASSPTFAGLEINSATVDYINDTPVNARIYSYVTGTSHVLFTSFAANGTEASPSAIANGDSIVAFRARGHDGTSFINAGVFDFEVDGAVSTSIVPVAFVLSTMNSSGTYAERFRIASSGAATFSSSIAATGAVTGSNLNVSNWDAAYTHVSSNGSDHSYIDQSVTTSASPAFVALGLSGALTTTSASGIIGSGVNLNLSRSGGSVSFATSISNCIMDRTTSNSAPIFYLTGTQGNAAGRCHLYIGADDTSLRSDSFYIQAQSGYGGTPVNRFYVTTLGGGYFDDDLDVGGDVDVTGVSTLSGLVEVGDGTTGNLIIRGAAATNRYIQYRTGTAASGLRWLVAGASDTAESGSNVGSDYRIHRYSDTGVYLGTALTLSRSSSLATFGGSLVVPGQNNVFGRTSTIGSGLTIDAADDTIFRMAMSELDASADEKTWEWVISGGNISLRTLNDALTVAANVFTATRTGTTVDTASLSATNITLSGATNITGALDCDTSLNVDGDATIDGDITLGDQIISQSTAGNILDLTSITGVAMYTTGIFNFVGNDSTLIHIDGDASSTNAFFGVYANNAAYTFVCWESGQCEFVGLSAAPTNNVANGQVYYNTTTSKLQVRAGGAWVNLH